MSHETCSDLRENSSVSHEINNGSLANSKENRVTSKWNLVISNANRANSNETRVISSEKCLSVHETSMAEKCGHGRSSNVGRVSSVTGARTGTSRCRVSSGNDATSATLATSAISDETGHHTRM